MANYDLRALAAVFAGGVVGTLARGGLTAVLPAPAATHGPWSTFVSNIAGALLIETTHANLMFQARAFTAALPVEFGDRITSYLPSAHRLVPHRRHPRSRRRRIPAGRGPQEEIIINAAGKNMSPANIENTIKAAAPLVGAMVAIGDGKPYNTALIVLDAETAEPYAAQRGLTDASAQALAADPDLVAQIASGVAAGNAKLSRVEQIKRFTVLPTFWEPGGDEVTLTMKLKRKPIAQKYATQIERLYDPEPGTEIHESAG